MPIQARQSECKMPVGTAIAGKPPLSAGRAALCGPQQRSPHGGRRLYSQRFDLIDASARLPAAEISAYIVPLCKASKLLAIRDILRLWLLVLRSTGLNCARER
jgi:hypothetical protein